MDRKVRTELIIIYGILLMASLPLSSVAEAGEVQGRVTSPKVRRFADVVVYLEGEGLGSTPPALAALMDQRGIRFEPHVLPVVEGTTVRFLNSDNTPHNIYSASETQKFNLGTFGKGEEKTVTFDTAGIVEVLCNVHQEMSGFIVVLPTGVYTHPDRGGRFTIKGVPAGSYVLVALHPLREPARQEVIVTPDGVTEVEITIE